MGSVLSPHAPTAPLEGDAGIEAWAARFITTRDLAVKVDPGRPPRTLASPAAAAVRIATPGRPAELQVVTKAKRSLQPTQLHTPRHRAYLLHTFWHHELQAAELMCWAVLAFPETPPAFRFGLVAVCRDEVRHMQLYGAELERLGHRLGDFPVRDWFWQRVASCTTPLQFVALMGLGLEGGNLDHAARYTEAFARAGDAQAARVQAIVGREEERHVRFAARWFSRWTGGLDFARWRQELPPPLSPKLMRGAVLARSSRQRAGMPPEFVDALSAC